MKSSLIITSFVSYFSLVSFLLLLLHIRVLVARRAASSNLEISRYVISLQNSVSNINLSYDMDLQESECDSTIVQSRKPRRPNTRKVPRCTNNAAFVNLTAIKIF